MCSSLLDKRWVNSSSRVGGVWGSVMGQGACARVILVLRDCIWNAPAASFFIPAFDDTGSLGSPPRQGGLSPWLHGFTLGDCLLFPCGE